MNHQNPGHYLEQWRYLDFDQKIHILHKESLNADFEKLMRAYGLDVKLREKRNSHEDKTFSTEDFDSDTLNLIRDVYKKDFELFGYDVENPSQKLAVKSR